MLLTESEAAETWCPFARVVQRDERGNPAAAGNREPKHRPSPAVHDRAASDATACIGSRCMAWRWFDGPFTNEPEHVKRPLTDKRRGFCGLAGTPPTS